MFDLLALLSAGDRSFITTIGKYVLNSRSDL